MGMAWPLAWLVARGVAYGLLHGLYMSTCGMCVRACVRACCACVRVRVRVCMCVFCRYKNYCILMLAWTLLYLPCYAVWFHHDSFSDFALFHSPTTLKA